MKIFIPPIKCQGIKSKLVLWIKENIENNKFGRWIEPFMGSGVVGFNIRPKYAIFADINPHLINFYNAIKYNVITTSSSRHFLEVEGKKLSELGQIYYNEVRARFNQEKNPFDFLFLNRSSFNGLIRFNGKGLYNVPFGHKPNRFSKAYITKIVNQIDYVSKAIKTYDWTFVCQDFRLTLAMANENDFIYCDPPYFGRHTDYYDSWSAIDENDLYQNLNNLKAKYILSTWHSNDFRENINLEKYKHHNIITKEHFYHLGAKETNRNPMKEALITNFPTNIKSIGQLGVNSIF